MYTGCASKEQDLGGHFELLVEYTDYPSGWNCRPMAAGPVFRRLRQEDYNFKANLGILVITHF